MKNVEIGAETPKEHLPRMRKVCKQQAVAEVIRAEQHKDDRQH